MLAELGAMPPQMVELPDGSVRIWAAGKGLVFTQCTGRMVLAHAEAVIAAVDSALLERPREAVVVHDLLDVESYEINVHTRLSAWSVATFQGVKRVVIGVRSPLLSLAVRTINLAVGGRFEVLESREKLHATARRELVYAGPRAASR